MKYNGHDYEIKFCDPSEDWGKHKGLFCINCAIADNEFYPTYAEAEAKAKRNIDDFVKAIPQTKQDWLDAKQYATTLATAIHAKHYPEVTQWEPLPDLLGVLTQIDNMTAGLTRETTSD